jgi:BRCT domain type II-containing protein
VFVVVGDFDLNGDGTIDYSGAEKIKALIEKWGGKAEDNVSSNTDFVILGSHPQMPKKPTFEETEADPMAMQKYEAAIKKVANYDEVQKQAQALSVPVFNTERFLYFTGYKSQADRPGAF